MVSIPLGRPASDDPPGRQDRGQRTTCSPESQGNRPLTETAYDPITKLTMPDIRHTRHSPLAAVILAAILSAPAWSQDAGTDSPDGLKLPADIASGTEPAGVAANENYTVREWRIGGRLERVTVFRDNHLTEVYENREVDSMWLTEEKELGEIPNMRRWTIGSW